MFNLRYNILAIYNVILAGFSSVLLIRVFTFGIYGEGYELPRYVLLIMFIGVVFDSAYVLNQRLLNAEMEFSAPHILSSFQTLFTLLLLSMRFGLYICSILLIPITNSIRSLFPGGLASHYYYALRLHQVVGNMVSGSSYAVFRSRVSQ